MVLFKERVEFIKKPPTPIIEVTESMEEEQEPSMVFSDYHP
jgi:hypothetical protein